MLTARPPVKFSGFSRADGSHVQGKVLAEEFTDDAFLGGRIRVRQPLRGYRVNVDTLLLAAAVAAEPGQRLMEAGCGVGAATLAVAARAPQTHFVAVERDSAMAELARANVVANGFSHRIEIVKGDALDRRAAWGVFDAVFFNPPFDLEGEGRPPAAERRHAHLADRPLTDWVAALADRLRGGGTLTLIQRAGRLAEILSALEGRLGGAEVIPVRPRAADAAKRVLVRARKGSRAPLRLYRGMDLHDETDAKHTPEVEAVLRGQAQIAWGD